MSQQSPVQVVRRNLRCHQIVAEEGKGGGDVGGAEVESLMSFSHIPYLSRGQQRKPSNQVQLKYLGPVFSKLSIFCLP